MPRSSFVTTLSQCGEVGAGSQAKGRGDKAGGGAQLLAAVKIGGRCAAQTPPLARNLREQLCRRPDCTALHKSGSKPHRDSPGEKMRTKRGARHAVQRI
eukprot:1221484-Pleurochrysis_carterae.AAC.1